MAWSFNIAISCSDREPSTTVATFPPSWTGDGQKRKKKQLHLHDKHSSLAFSFPFRGPSVCEYVMPEVSTISAEANALQATFPPNSSPDHLPHAPIIERQCIENKEGMLASMMAMDEIGEPRVG